MMNKLAATAITSDRVPFSKVILTGLFAGILATLLCYVFDIFFRLSTNYGPSDYINVSSITFIVNILLLVGGLVYYALRSWLKRPNMFFTILCLAVTVFCIWMTSRIHRFDDIRMNREFIQLLGGTIIIIGTATLCIPWFYQNKKILDFFYEEDV
jgi:hypothetical protein